MNFSEIMTPYLMRQYGIKAPLRTQGWINEKLVWAAIEDGVCEQVKYRAPKNARCSQTVFHLPDRARSSDTEGGGRA